jgi:hypothetical protein
MLVKRMCCGRRTGMERSGNNGDTGRFLGWADWCAARPDSSAPAALCPTSPQEQLLLQMLHGFCLPPQLRCWPGSPRPSVQGPLGRRKCLRFIGL